MVIKAAAVQKPIVPVVAGRPVPQGTVVLYTLGTNDANKVAATMYSALIQSITADGHASFTVYIGKATLIKLAVPHVSLATPAELLQIGSWDFST